MISSHTINDIERAAWWRLSRTEGIGSITFFKLIERYGSAQRALEALPDLARRGGRKAPLIAFSETEAKKEIENINRIGARIIAAIEPDYPDLLRRLDDAPPVLVIRGNISIWKRPCIGIVGARNASLPGRKMAFQLARDLGAKGYTVVSGLARGIDTAAHEGSLATGTVAVVAGGVDVIYPPENEKLYQQICESGVIISEHPVGLEPKAPFFPRRNRMISGLSTGTVVVEATMNSGSLITARFASEQGRDVFAVPGSPLDPRASGPNRLIRDGAVLIENADHVVDHLTLFKTIGGASEPACDSFTPDPQEPDEQTLATARAHLLDCLSYTPITIDEVVRTCQVNVQTIQIVLLELELAERIERLPGNRIALIDKEFLSEPERARHR